MAWRVKGGGGGLMGKANPADCPKGNKPHIIVNFINANHAKVIDTVAIWGFICPPSPSGNGRSRYGELFDMTASIKLTLIAATSLFAFQASIVQAQTVTARNLYSFGDQSSSVGNDGWIWDPARGFSGPTSTFAYANTRGFNWRYSNGPTWVERLGYQQGLAPALAKIQAPSGGFSGLYRGYSFAHANAALVRDTNAGGNPNSSSSTYSFEAQVDYYKSLVQSGRVRTAANDLFTYWDNSSFNEYTPLSDIGTPTNRVFNNLRSVANSRATIVALGQITPVKYATETFSGRGTRPTSNFDTYSRVANDALDTYARTQGGVTGKARVIYIDTNALITAIQANPAQYGIQIASPTFLSSTSSCGPTGICITTFRYQNESTLASGYSGSAFDDPYLFYFASESTATLTWRGNQILADYVASNLAGVYAWDQFRAVGSGSGARALAATGVVVGAPTAFAQTTLGFASTTNAKGTKTFALGFGDGISNMSSLDARGGSLRVLGTSTQLTPRLTIGASSFVDEGRYDDLSSNVKGRGGAGFATLDLGSNLDLNILAASQSRTINTARPITFQYVGGIARARTTVNLDLAQASLSRMFDVKGVKIGPVASVASVRERWGKTRETGVPEWLAVNRDAGGFSSMAYNLGVAGDFSFTDKSGGTWNLSAKAGQIQTDEWTSVALLAPSQTLADALEAEKGSASYVTLGMGRSIDNGWSLGLEAGMAKTVDRDVGALRARAILTF